MIAQARGAATIAWIEQPASSWAAFEALRLYGLRYAEGGRVLALLPLLAAVPALAAVPWRRVPATLVLLAFVVGVPWLTYAAGLVATPLWIERTLLWPVPLGLVLVAAGAVRLRPRWLAAGVAGLLVAAQLADLALYATTVKKPPLAAAAAGLADAWRPGDGLLLVPGATQLPLAYYLHRDGLPFAALAVEFGAGDEALDGAYRERPVGPPLGQPLQGITLDQLTGLPERYRRVWVLFRREEKADPGGRVLARLRELGTVAAERHFEPRLDLALVVLAAPGCR